MSSFESAMTKQPHKKPEGARVELGEMFEAVGDAITAWAAVEDAAFLAFSAIIQAKQPDAVSAAFHALSTFGPKLDMIHAAMTHGLSKHPAVLDDWNNLHNRLRRASKKRNKIAHLPAWIVNGRAVLGPSYLNVRGSPRQELAVHDVLSYSRHFGVLFDELYEFVYKRLPKPPYNVSMIDG
jgi:hypothetical protein